MPDDYDLVSIDHAATGWMGVQQPGPHVLRVHPASKCAGETCVIHNPSDHHMRGWKLNWRGDTGVMERLCQHGVGHPDPDATVFAKSQGRDAYGMHGCDGCCRPYREMCAEADARDAMDDPEFWEHVLGLSPASDDDGPDLDVQITTDPCAVCGAPGACSYDAEGLPLIHTTSEEDQ